MGSAGEASALCGGGAEVAGGMGVATFARHLSQATRGSRRGAV